MVITVVVVHRLIAFLLASDASDATAGMLQARPSFFITAFHFAMVLLALAGSALAILGAIKLTEWSNLPLHSSRKNKLRPWVKVIWIISVAETAVLLIISIMWIVLA